MKTKLKTSITKDLRRRQQDPATDTTLLNTVCAEHGYLRHDCPICDAMIHGLSLNEARTLYSQLEPGQRIYWGRDSDRDTHEIRRELQKTAALIHAIQEYKDNLERCETANDISALNAAFASRGEPFATAAKIVTSTPAEEQNFTFVHSVLNQ